MVPQDRSTVLSRIRPGWLVGAFAAVIVGALALSGCVATAPQGKADNGALNVAFTVAPSTLDPASGCTTEDFQLAMEMYVQLVQYGSKDDKNGFQEADPASVKPYFAKSWDASKDGLTYTFHLENGWTFPSGKPINAEAVKYSIDRVIAIDGCSASIVNDLYRQPNLITSIDAPDDSTVIFHLSKPDSAFLLAMATTSASIVDPSLVEANGGIVPGKPNEWMASHDAGSGPFRLKSFEPGVSAILARDPNFKGTPAASKTINVSWVKSDAALLLKAQNGSADVTYGLSKNSVSSLEKNKNLTIASNTATLNMQLLMPNNKAPWNNQKLREAVTYAIPYQGILDKVLHGYGELYYGPTPPTLVGYDKAHSAPRTYDVDKAKQLVADSGVKGPVNVKLDILSGDAAQASISVILQDSLKAIGINVDVQTLSESAWGDAVYNGTTQMALRLDGPAVATAGYYLQYDEDCRSQYNTGHICIEANNALLDTARSALNDQDRDAAYAQLTKNWVAASPKAILYLDRTAVVLNKSVKNYFYAIDTDMRSWSK